MKITPKTIQVFTTAVAMLGIIGIISYQMFRDELSIHALFSYSRLGYLVLASIFIVFSIHQISVVFSKQEWGPNRFASAIRLPIYVVMAGILLYIAISGKTLI